MPGEIRFGVVLAFLLHGVAAPMCGQMAPAATQTMQMQAGQLERDRDAYEQELIRNPNDARALEGMSVSSERLALNERASGSMDGALATLLRAKKLEPGDRRILLDLGVLENEMALFLDAEITLQDLETIPPVDPNTFYALARVDLNLGKLSEAEEQMQAYLHVVPRGCFCAFRVGAHLYAGFSVRKKPRAELRRSIELQPKQSEAYYQLGELQLSENKFSRDSIKSFATALERSPDHGGALAGTGTAYFRLKQYDKAREWLLKATQAAPEYQLGHYYLGLTLARLGDGVESRKELDLATSLAAKDSKQAASRLRLNPDGQP